MTWLLERSKGETRPWTPPNVAETFRRYKTMSAGGGSQLMKFRLPTDRYVQLQDWCAEHDLSMASVIRCLVESHLDRSASSSAAQQRSGKSGRHPWVERRA